MADTTYTTIKVYVDANLNANAANDITGAELNTGLNYLVDGLAGKLFDATKPYKTGQTVIYNHATFGNELWTANSDLAAAAWNSASFTRLSKRSQKLTTNTATYIGINAIATNTYAHLLGHTDFTIQAFDSSGGLIPLDITTKSTTQIIINSSVAYASAVIFINEIVIP